MRKTEIRVEPAEAFFERGRNLARLADRGGRIPPNRVIAFDDIESLLTRDVQALERVGVLRVTEKPLPGHGKQKWIAPVAREIQLTAQL